MPAGECGEVSRNEHVTSRRHTRGGRARVFRDHFSPVRRERGWHDLLVWVHAQRNGNARRLDHVYGVDENARGGGLKAETDARREGSEREGEGQASAEVNGVI
jgi:hypothetical protein